MDFQPSAVVIADSISPRGDRLTTFQVHLHRYMLAEFNTHRVLSRNSASSRAIPVSKTMATVADNCALPLRWAREQRGMQGGPEIDNPQKARDIWLSARDAAVVHAEQLVQLGVHKSIANRLLEPFLPHVVICTATDWDGFYAQRCNPDAQIEIRTAAEAMRVAYHESTPTWREPGEWHLPYIRDDERNLLIESLTAISAARCARVSYLTHDGRRDPHADLDLYHRLVTATPPHASPLEHVATPGEGMSRHMAAIPGNFRGWHQLRHRVLGR